MNGKELTRRLKNSKATAAEARHLESRIQKERRRTSARDREESREADKVLEGLLRELDETTYSPGEKVEVMVATFANGTRLPLGSSDRTGASSGLTGVSAKVWQLLKAAAGESGWYPSIEVTSRIFEYADDVIYVRYGKRKRS